MASDKSAHVVRSFYHTVECALNQRLQLNKYIYRLASSLREEKLRGGMGTRPSMDIADAGNPEDWYLNGKVSDSFKLVARVRNNCH